MIECGKPKIILLVVQFLKLVKIKLVYINGFKLQIGAEKRSLTLFSQEVSDLGGSLFSSAVG